MDWFYHTTSRKLEAKDIYALTEGNIPSHKHLQYMAGKDFSMSENALLKLAKTVNAMANGGGGMLIIGVASVRKKAKNLSPLNKETFAIDQIHQYILANNQPFLDNLELLPVELSEGWVLCVRIPAGNVPFMFSDYRYYGLKNDKIEKLEEADVRALYHQARHKQLEIYSIYNTQGIPEMKDGKFVSLLFYPRILIRNLGQAAENYYKMEVYLPSSLYEENNALSDYFSRYESEFAVFSVAGKSPIFGNEILKLLEFKFRLTAENITAFEKYPLKIRLYYSDGMHEQNLVMKDIFMYRNKMLSAGDFV